jgi:hypothetical protein
MDVSLPDIFYLKKIWDDFLSLILRMYLLIEILKFKNSNKNLILLNSLSKKFYTINFFPIVKFSIFLNFN